MGWRRGRSTMKSSSGTSALCALAWFAAVACGGGSNTNSGLPDGGGGGGGGTAGGPWLLYSGGGVFAVDANSPSAAPVPVQQLSNVGGLRNVQRGTWSATSGQASATEPHAAIWTAGGKIWRASATAGLP